MRRTSLLAVNYALFRGKPFGHGHTKIKPGGKASTTRNEPVDHGLLIGTRAEGLEHVNAFLLAAPNCPRQHGRRQLVVAVQYLEVNAAHSLQVNVRLVLPEEDGISPSTEVTHTRFSANAYLGCHCRSCVDWPVNSRSGYALQFFARHVETFVKLCVVPDFVAPAARAQE